MYEKKLNFRIHSLDVNNGEQYSEYYLALSRTSEIPVLEDGINIIAGALKILNYLDSKYSDISSGKIKLYFFNKLRGFF